MTLELINPAGLPTPPTYTHVVIATGSKLVFIAGQEPEDEYAKHIGLGDLAGTRILGSTKVEDAAELYAEQAFLRNNVTADPGAYVDLFESTVGENVRLNEVSG